MEYREGIKVFGDWQIVKLIGEGASGKVYEIMKKDPHFTAENAPKSALKVIRIPMTENDIDEARSEGQNYASISANYQEYRDEIVNEVALLSKLKSHPNIVSYEDHHVLQQENGIGWDIQIRMELLTSLTKYLREHFMTEQEVLELAKDLCRALAFCQKEGLIHRDIKPQNIFVSTTGQFKLGDFGVARTVEKTTGGLSLKGTESYMAPEVFYHQNYGKTVDIYSLGLVLYMLLNENRLPFYPLGGASLLPKDKENALTRRMQGEVLPPPAHASEAMVKVILKACAFEPKQRYHTAEEMLQDLEKIRLDEGNTQEISELLKPSKTENSLEEDETIGEVSLSGAPKEIYVNGIGWIPYPLTKEVLEKITKERRKGRILKVSITAAILAIIGAVILMFIYPIKKTATINSGSGSGKYKKEEIVSIEADKAEEGYVFSKWVVDSGKVELLNENALVTSFVMPEEEVEITALYEKQYQLTVGNGSGSGMYLSGDEIQIIAENAEDGYVFKEWLVEEGTLELEDKTAQTISFVMPEGDVEITATYSDICVEIQESLVNDCVTFGQYEQNNVLSDGKEDIEWIVLDQKGDYVLLISRYGLDVQPYHSTWTEVTWEECSLRAWLNTTFLESAFNNTEQKAILSVTNDNPDNIVYKTNGGNDTTDTVFLLSFEEAKKYFKNADDRATGVTEYAKKQGAYLEGGKNVYWWLRSPGTNECNDSALVTKYGEIDMDGSCVDRGGRVVRPAIWVDIKG